MWHATFISGIKLLRLSISWSRDSISFYNFYICWSLFPDAKNDLKVDFPDWSFYSSYFDSIRLFSAFCLRSYAFFRDSIASINARDSLNSYEIISV